MIKRLGRRRFIKTTGKAVGAAWLVGSQSLQAFLPPATEVYVVPNTHGTVAGWLVDFDTERNYCLNNYLDHLDRVASDKNYRFAYSEVPNLISFLQFAGDRLNELKARIREKRVELCNGFFLESTINLSGGEALVQLGVQGLRWYDRVFGLRPQLAWNIDVVGNDRQMPQIVSGLGLETMIFCRNNPARKTAFWWVAPDGTRLLTLCGMNTYLELRELFATKVPLRESQLRVIAKTIEWKKDHSPSPQSLLILAGSGDYSLAPLVKIYPTEFLKQWAERYPDLRIRFSIPSDYVDALQNEIQTGKVSLEEVHGDAAYCYNAFWYDIPQIKGEFRRLEHQLQAAEMLATVASLRGNFRYPSQDLYNAWINLLMNMDRNALWGAAAGIPFLSSRAWNIEDRYAAVDRISAGIINRALGGLAGAGGDLALFNPLNWERRDPIELSLPADKRLSGVPCEKALGDSLRVFYQPTLPPIALLSFPVQEEPAPSPKPIDFRDRVETDFYRARFDGKTGALTSLKLRSTGNEVLGGPANVVVVESVAGILKDPADWMLPRPLRKVLVTSNHYAQRLQAFQGPLSTSIVAASDFYGGSKLKRIVRFYHHFPRIDFEIDLDLRADDVLITVDFPLANEIAERMRGIPYGFASIDPKHPFRPLKDYMIGESKLYGFSDAILPAVRWSHYQFRHGGGLALLDRGLAAHELNGRTVTLGLINAHSEYRKLPNKLLGGQGHHHFSYALLPHGGAWRRAALPRYAWEFNAPVLSRAGSRAGLRQTYLDLSGDVIVHAMRREGRQVELRFVEWSGTQGKAKFHLALPHRRVALTNLMGERAAPLKGGSPYRIPIRPQQIVTVRFDTSSEVETPEVVRDWATLAPPAKRKDLKRRIETKGHPPFGK